jgi:hypothetical protein
VQEKQDDLKKAIATTDAAASTPVPILSWDFQSMRFDQRAAPATSNFESF